MPPDSSSRQSGVFKVNTKHLRSKILIQKLNLKFSDEYSDVILKNLRKLCLANTRMMDLQPELDWSMRPFLVDFLIEVALGFKLQATTLHLAINIIDRYTSRRVVYKKHYQLLGCSALWSAAKYEESKDKVPTLKELRQMCCDSYTENMFVQMESHILKTLDWQIGAPTCDIFLTSFLTNPLQKYSSDSQSISSEDYSGNRSSNENVRGEVDYSNSNQYKMINALANFFCDLALYSKEFIEFNPFLIANVACSFAQHINQCVSTCSISALPRLQSYDHMMCLRAMAKKLFSASRILRDKYAKSYNNATQFIDDYERMISNTKIHPIISVTPPHTPENAQQFISAIPDSLPTPPFSSLNNNVEEEYAIKDIPAQRSDNRNSQQYQIMHNVYTQIDFSDDEDEEMNSPCSEDYMIPNIHSAYLNE